MKFSNILFSIFLHAVLIIGMACGLQCQDEVEEERAESVFFEILEECVVAASEPTKPLETLQKTEPATTPDPEKTTDPIDENSIRNEISGLPESENNARSVMNTRDLGSLTVENSVRTEFSDEADDADETDVRKEEEKAEGIDNEGIDKDGTERVVDVDEKKSVVHRDVHLEKSEAVKPVEQDQAKVVSVPKALNRIVPVYPRSARRRGREGVVTIEISVSDSGEVSGVEVIAGSGHKDLDSAAVSAVRTARFAPATEDGVQVHGRLRLTFEFKLR